MKFTILIFCVCPTILFSENHFSSSTSEIGLGYLDRHKELLDQGFDDLVIPSGKKFVYASVEGISGFPTLGELLPVDDVIVGFQNFATCTGARVWINLESIDDDTSDVCKQSTGTFAAVKFVGVGSRILNKEYEILGYVAGLNASASLDMTGEAALILAREQPQDWQSVYTAGAEDYLAAFGHQQPMAGLLDQITISDENDIVVKYSMGDSGALQSQNRFWLVENSNGPSDIILEELPSQFIWRE